MPPRYDNPGLLAAAGPTTLLKLAEREPRPVVAGHLRDLANTYSAARRIEIAELIVEETRGSAERS